MSEQKESPGGKAELLLREIDGGLQETLQFLTPKTEEARRIFNLKDQDLYWGSKQGSEFERSLVQAHLAMVELFTLGELNNEAKEHYLDLLKWQQEHSLGAGEDKRSLEKSLNQIGLLDCQRLDDQEKLLEESRNRLQQLKKKGLFRAEFGTLLRIEKRIGVELGPQILFRKSGEGVVVAQ